MFWDCIAVIPNNPYQERLSSSVYMKMIYHTSNIPESWKRAGCVPLSKHSNVLNERGESTKNHVPFQMGPSLFCPWSILETTQAQIFAFKTTFLCGLYAAGNGALWN